MDDNYINFNFNTLDDLCNITSKLQELNELQLQLNDIAESKTAGKKGSVAGSITKVNQEEFDSAIKNLTSDVSKFDIIGEKDHLKECDELLEKYGQLPVLLELRTHLETRSNVSLTIDRLRKLQAIDTRLDRDLSLTELKNMYQEINSLNEKDNLLEKFNNKFNTKRDELMKQFQETLTTNKWLSNTSIPNEALTLISRQFNELICLQSIVLIPSYPETWWGLNLLLEPIITRFNYHFNSVNKETNKLSKPEWALDFLETFLHDNLGLLCIIVDDTFKALNRIGTYEVITCLLIPLRSKIENMIDLINERVADNDNTVSLEKNGRILSHLVFELSSFDQRIKAKYKYNPFIIDFEHVPENKWLGITSDILLNDLNHAAKNWLEFENKLALKRFKNEIINAPDAFIIDHDYQGLNHEKEISLHILKPTYSAYGLVKLINNLNSHFQTLNIVKYQLQFVSRIQLGLIDKYYDIIKKHYKEFNNKYSFKNALNMIPGSMVDESINKNKNGNDNTINEHIKNGITFLTEIFCSTKYISNELENWSNQLVFIQLWSTYTGLSSELSEDRSIFDSALKQYDDLVNKILKSYDELFKSEIKQLLKKYVNLSEWDSPSATATQSPDKNSELEPSVYLTPLISLLPQYLDIISRSVSQLDYFIISDNTVSTLCQILFEYVLTNNEFDRNGINQLLVDFGYIVKFLQYSLNLNTLDTYSDAFEYSNDTNSDYVKIVQAIDLLDSVDHDVITNFNQEKLDHNSAKLNEFVTKLRLKYQHELKELTNYDIQNLLSRVVY